MIEEVGANFKVDSPQKFFKFYVELLNPLLKLTSREKEVLSALLLIYYSNKDNPNISTLLLSTSTRRALRNTLKLSEPSLNNSLTVLRKKNLIDNNQLNKLILKFPKDNKLKITYSIELEQ